MGSDPRTCGGARPTETVTLVRTPLGIPVRPTGPTYGTGDVGHRGLSSAGAIARGTGHGIEAADLSLVAPAASAQEGMRELEQVWGAGKADANAATFARYLDSLPAAERKAIETNPRADDPAYVQELMVQASAPQPRAQTEAGILEFMKTHPAAYRKDARLQERFRALVDERLEREAAKGQ